MGKLILVTGGARSGKSSFAEACVKKYGNNILYVATSIPFDEEMKLRVQKHREQRPSEWETVEAYRDMDTHLTGELEGKDAAMLDCITIMVSNLIFEKQINWDELKGDDINVMEQYVKTEMEKLLDIIDRITIPFIIVTNETGMGIVPENALARVFRDIAGRTNQLLAKAADEVYLCVSGIPIKIK